MTRYTYEDIVELRNEVFRAESERISHKLSQSGTSTKPEDCVDFVSPDRVEYMLRTYLSQGITAAGMRAIK